MRTPLTHIVTFHSLKHATFAAAIAGLATFAMAFTGLKAVTAKAHPAAAKCYRIKRDNSPLAVKSTRARFETWCYKELENGQGARLVYNIDDQGRIVPELSVLVEADGSVVHTSLRSGQISVHRARGDFSPTGAPLRPPAGSERIAEPSLTTAADAPDSSLHPLWDYADIQIHPIKVQAGEIQATVPPESMPWRGYWFPYSSGRLHNGDDSPLAKYDKFISRRADQSNLGSQKWEKANHFYHGVSWSGHCNGWAAASVMAPEPKKPITDPFSGVTFKVSDLKGLLIVRHYCPKLVFYGSRADESSTGGILSASTFHSVLTYFIGELKKPVAMDIFPGPTVENSVVTGYQMKITRSGARSFYVQASLEDHNYDNNIVEEPGVAPSQTKTYAYTLSTNDDGEILSGSWASRNPDFLWVPIAPGDCEERNKTVDPFWVDEILKYGAN